MRPTKKARRARRTAQIGRRRLQSHRRRGIFEKRTIVRGACLLRDGRRAEQRGRGASSYDHQKTQRDRDDRALRGHRYCRLAVGAASTRLPGCVRCAHRARASSPAPSAAVDAQSSAYDSGRGILPTAADRQNCHDRRPDYRRSMCGAARRPHRRVATGCSERHEVCPRVIKPGVLALLRVAKKDTAQVPSHSTLSPTVY